METLRNFFDIDENTFLTPRARQQARLLIDLNIYALLLVAGLMILGLTIFIEGEGFLLLFSSAAALGVLIIGSRALLRRGYAQAAASLYVFGATAIALWMVAVDGLPSQTILVLVVPIILSGLLADRRYVRVVVVLLIGGLLLIALIQGGGWEGERSPWVAFLPAMLLVGFLGALQMLMNREVDTLYDSFRRLQVNQVAASAVSDQLPQATRLEEYLRQFGLVLQDNFGLQQVQIFLRSLENPNLIELRAGIGVAAQRAQIEGRATFMAADNPIAATLRSQEPIVFRSTSLAMLQTELLPGSNSQALVPILCNNQAIGVLDLQSPHADDFDDEKLKTLAGLANYLGAMVLTLHSETRLETLQEEHARLYAHLERNAQETQRLRRQVAGVIWDRFFQERQQAVIGFDVLPEAEEPVPSGTLSETMQASLHAGAVEVRPTATGQILTVPIKQRNEVLGVMEFEIDRQEALPGYVVNLAAVIAERLSLALDNARLVEQTQATAFREQRVGEITRRLQDANSMEILLNTAVEEFNAALGGVHTHIRLQLEGAPAAAGGASHNGGGVA